MVDRAKPLDYILYDVQDITILYTNSTEIHINIFSFTIVLEYDASIFLPN